MKTLPMIKCLYVSVAFLILVGLACNLPVSASYANFPDHDGSSLLVNDPKLELLSEQGDINKDVSQSEDVVFQASVQMVDSNAQLQSFTQPTATFTPTSQYPWDTTTILQGGATAQPDGTPYVFVLEPTATPAIIIDSEDSLPTQPVVSVIQSSPTLRPTAVQATLVPKTTTEKMSSLTSSSGLFSALSRWFPWKKSPKPTQIVPTATAVLPIAATLQPTVYSPSAQPTATPVNPTEAPKLPQPTQPPVTATLFPPTPTQLPATATPLPPSPTPVLPTATSSASAPASSSFYWSTGFETGNLSELEANSYGGFVNQGNGTYKLVNSPAHSGKYAAALTIDTSQSSPTGAHAAYMFFWKELPGEAYYYSAWYYIPSGTLPAEWWNLWQWKSTYDGNSDNSQRIFSIGARPLNGGLGLYLVQRLPDGSKVNHNSTRNIPLDQWFHIEGYYRQAFDTTGQVIVWQDGVEVFNITNAQTVLSDLTVDWSVNNYSNQISPSPCTIYVDDIAVSSSRIGH